MGASTTSGDTITVASSEWVTFLSELTREYMGSHARVEVLGMDFGDQVETENRPFQGIAADTKGGENTIWISLGSLSGEHHAHGVHGVTAIRMLPLHGAGGGASGTVLELETKTGTKTMLTLTRPEDFALPPGTSK
jgi:hypothetical protein